MDLRCQAHEREHSDIVLYADDEDKPQAKRKVLDVSDTDLLLRPFLFAPEYLLCTPVKQAQHHATQQRKEAEEEA